MSATGTEFDVAFLHPPSSFEKLRYPLGGIFESTTGTTDLLTMAPIGMFSMANRLDEAKFRVKVFNVAKILLQQRQDPSIDAWRFVDQIRARIYGIGLHWSVHAPGAIELARRIKERNPDARIIFGGLTATIYWKELLDSYPFIDAVALGECEHIITPLTRALLTEKPDYAKLTNIAFRKDGESYSATITLPDDSERASFFPHSHLQSPEPRLFDREEMMQHYPLLRGCNRDCRFCGGSRYSYDAYFGRSKHSHASLSHFQNFLNEMTAHGSKVLRIYGDTRAFGQEFDAALRHSLSAMGHKLDVALEVFTLPSLDYLRAWREVANNLVLILSPESTFPELRAIHGKDFSNDDIHQLADWCGELGINLVCSLMYAMPGHTRERILGELKFFEEMLQRHPEVFMAFQPYLFLDPGCEIFSCPEKYGARIHFKTLHDIVKGTTRAHWYYSIGYELDGLNRDELFETILDVSLKKAHLYHAHGQLSAVNLLKTYENVLFHRRIYEFIRQENPDDMRLNAFICAEGPGYLRNSNSSLVKRPFVGHILPSEYSLDAALYDAFPITLELMTRFDLLPLAEYVDKANDFCLSHKLAQCLNLLNLADNLANFFETIFSKRGLRIPFLKDLVKFEWYVYAFYYASRRNLPEISAYQTSYNFDSMKEFLAQVRLEGSSLVADQCESFYNFDPEAPVSRSRLSNRKLNIFCRKTFCLAPSLKALLKSQHGMNCDQDFQELRP